MALEAVASLDSGCLVDDGATSMTSWLVARFGMSHGDAAEWVRVGRALEGLPAIRDRFGEGSLRLIGACGGPNPHSLGVAEDSFGTDEHHRPALLAHDPVVLIPIVVGSTRRCEDVT